MTISSMDEEKISAFLGAFPSEFIGLPAQGQKVSAPIYRLLAAGQPVAIEELADTLNMPHIEVKSTIEGWPGVFFDDGGKITGYWGLSVTETPHRFRMNGHTLYTWCALDSLFIPQIIGQMAYMDSLDPETKESIRITVAPQGVLALEPAGAVMSFMMPHPEQIRADVIRSFCHYVHLLTSEDTAAMGISRSDKPGDMVILTLEDAYKFGARKNELQYRSIFGAGRQQASCHLQEENQEEGDVMSDLCCTVPNLNPNVREAGLCPTCGQKGKPVGAVTINALVRPELKPEGGFPDGYYYPNPEDVTLYFFDSGLDAISKDDAKVRVGFKETEGPQLVCYCFEHTKDEIQEEFRAHGESRIEASIREKVTAGSCSCEFMNPKGNCCLGDVRATYKALAAAEEMTA